jgi:(4S)-4-hydroxy-5-phosphonooxypentane-2,3-dione isomerase
MYIVTVQLQVKADKVDEFLQYTLHNASEARKEKGCLRFDVLRHETEATRFFFYEVYVAPGDHKAHQETPHYQRWRDHVPDLLEGPRIGTRYVNVSPQDASWK